MLTPTPIPAIALVLNKGEGEAVLVEMPTVVAVGLAILFNIVRLIAVLGDEAVTEDREV
jgi:hypothetical protein